MSAAVTSPPPKLLTAEEYAALPDDGLVTELVRGVVVEYPFCTGPHGYVCANIGSELWKHVRHHDLGRVMQRSGIITCRDPDCVRGPDVSFFSYSRLPRGPLPTGYPDVMPELVVEVVDSAQEWREVYAKIEEYHTAGVGLVVVADTERELVVLFRKGELGTQFRPSDELTLPGVFPDFRVPVRTLFE